MQEGRQPTKSMWSWVALQTSETRKYRHTFTAPKHLFVAAPHHCTDTADVADTTDCHPESARQLLVCATGLLCCQSRAVRQWQGSCRLTAPATQAWFVVISMMEDEDSEVLACTTKTVCVCVWAGGGGGNAGERGAGGGGGGWGCGGGWGGGGGGEVMHESRRRVGERECAGKDCIALIAEAEAEALKHLISMLQVCIFAHSHVR